MFVVFYIFHRTSIKIGFIRIHHKHQENIFYQANKVISSPLIGDFFYLFEVSKHFNDTYSVFTIKEIIHKT